MPVYYLNNEPFFFFLSMATPRSSEFTHYRDAEGDQSQARTGAGERGLVPRGTDQ